MSTFSPRNGTPSASSSLRWRRALGQRAVGAHDPEPGQVRVVRAVQHGAGEARRAGRDVAVGAHEARRRRADAREHGGAPVARAGSRSRSSSAGARRVLGRLHRAASRSSSAVQRDAPSRRLRRSSPLASRTMRHGTYSIVARDPETGELGGAVQSHWFSVGSLCVWTRPGIGAVATQSVVEPAYGPNALDRLADGIGAAQALGELLAADPLAAVRQVAVDRRARRPLRAHRRRLHPARGPRDRRAPQRAGQHDGPRDRAAGDVGRVHQRRRPAVRAPVRGAGGRRGRGRRRPRPPERRARRRPPPRASRGDGPSTCASRITPSRCASCAACSRSSARTTWRAPPTSCWPPAASRRPASATARPR